MEFEASDLRIRPAVEEDVPFLVELRNEFLGAFLSGTPATMEGTKALLPGMYVAEVGGKRIGTFSLYNRDSSHDSIEFGRFVIEFVYRHQGYGQEMLRYAIELAREEGFRSVVLTVKGDNTPANSLYCSEGFCVTHTTMELKL